MFREKTSEFKVTHLQERDLEKNIEILFVKELICFIFLLLDQPHA